MSKLHHLFSFMLAFLFIGSFYAQASTNVKLEFERTGTTAQSVSIKVLDQNGNPIQGAVASVECSKPFKGNAANIGKSILCPNINGNASPNVNLTFNISGLPTDFSFKQLQLDLHAFNGSGKYQANGDGISRQYNLVAKTGKTSSDMKLFGSLDNFDAAAGVGESDNVHKIWIIDNKDGVVTDGNLILSLNITAGSTNKGCFLGVSQIVLSNDETVDPKPEPQPNPELGDTTKIYKVLWKNTTDSHMAEEADGTVVVTDYDVAQRLFWKFIPTKNKNCYYIQNTATGRYIGSCNTEPSSTAFITTTEKPVEYYVGKTASTNSEITNCYYMSSTDCPNFNNENQGPRALNKAGSSNSVITWQAGPNRIGSYWKLIESEDLYEVRPFLATEKIGNAGYLYAVSNAKGQHLEMSAEGSLSWKEQNDSDEQTWYFVGVSSHDGGYLIVNQKYQKPYTLPGQTDTRWIVLDSPKGDGYIFRPVATKDDASTNLEVEGESALAFRSVHSQFARNNQVYELPCGTLGNHYLTRLNITGDVIKPMQYPLAVMSNNSIVTNDAEAPNYWYTLYTHDKAIVAPGKKFTVSTSLNAVPLVGQKGFLYCDWNHDGIFEATFKMTLSQHTETAITVPAEATEGKARLRFRLTDNGMSEADDEVTGQIFDCMLYIANETSVEPTLTVLANSEERGSVSPATDSGMDKACEVTATPKGDAIFVCWREGNNVVSLEQTYKFTLNHETTLTAYFSPNTQDEISGINNHFAEKNQMVTISANHKQIKVISNANVKKVLVFTPTGALVAQSNTTSVDLSNATTGTYIVKVYTDVADQTTKIIIK